MPKMVVVMQSPSAPCVPGARNEEQVPECAFLGLVKLDVMIAERNLHENECRVWPRARSVFISLDARVDGFLRLFNGLP